MTMTPQTFTVGEGDDLITYDVRGDLSSGTAAVHVRLADGRLRVRQPREPLRPTGPVVTYDPRGTGRNPTGTAEVTPEQHAADLHRVIEALGVGPVDAFGSSGGAVNLLALCAAHPERRPDRGGARAADLRRAARRRRRCWPRSTT